MIKTLPLEVLRPNPFRELDKSYFDEDVIVELMESMSRNGVWAGIRARQNNGVYEIAFGHHRLEAMKRLKVKEAIVDVQKIDDLHMITEMADENMADKRPNTKGITNVVGAAKKKLEEILSGLETWEDAGAETRVLFESGHGFNQWKRQGNGEVGKVILSRFLGGRWESNIKEALALIAREAEGKLDLKAAQLFDSPTHAAVFSETVEELKIPVAKQEKFAKELIHEIENSVSEEDKEKGRKETVSSERIRTRAHIKVFGHELEEKELQRPDASEALKDYIRDLNYMTSGMEEILENWEQFPERLQKEYRDAFMGFVELHKNILSREKKWTEKLLLTV